jgi:hypothetical protein
MPRAEQIEIEDRIDRITFSQIQVNNQIQVKKKKYDGVLEEGGSHRPSEQPTATAGPAAGYLGCG